MTSTCTQQHAWADTHLHYRDKISKQVGIVFIETIQWRIIDIIEINLKVHSNWFPIKCTRVETEESFPELAETIRELFSKENKSKNKQANNWTKEECTNKTLICSFVVPVFKK